MVKSGEPGSEALTARRASSRGKFWLRFSSITAIALLIIVATGAWLTLRSGRSLAPDQRAYGATVIACDLVGQWVEKSGAWPKSWTDLESLPGRNYSSMSWPRDEAEVRSLIDIDFGATVAGALAERPDQFTAVRMHTASSVFNPAPIYRSFQERLSHAGKR
jgi:hypothetical protein